ncbi:hypothetical protein C8R43DRAFT_1177846 [Mycena crocata]|nr:hypothetical protein C8R43DRAFT_1177846 [Mycena crocata]
MRPWLLLATGILWLLLSSILSPASSVARAPNTGISCHKALAHSRTTSATPTATNMDGIPKCQCGKTYTQEAHLNRHMNTCPRVLDVSRRSWAIADARQNKRPRVEITTRSERVESNSTGAWMFPQPKTKARRAVRTRRREGSSASSSSHHNRYASLARDDAMPLDDLGSPSFRDTPSRQHTPNCTPPPLSPSAAEQPLPAKRVRRPTAKALQALEDALPEGPGPLEEEDETPAAVRAEPPAAAATQRVILRVPRVFRTAANTFGLSRVYRRKPTAIPDLDGSLKDHIVSSLQNTSKTISPRALSDIIWPYPNLSSWLFGKWFWNEGDKKTKGARKGLLDILLSGAFSIEDLRGVNFDKIDNVLGTTDTSELAWEGNGWKTSTVTIKLPVGKKATKEVRRQRANEAQTAKRYDLADPEADKVETRKFTIPNFHHRKKYVHPQPFLGDAQTIPTRVLIATLRDMDLPGLGTPKDTAVRVEQVRRDDTARRDKVAEARKLIYEDGYVVNSTKVDDILKEESLVPTENAFSERLDGLDFDVFDCLVADFMHETELGDFKNLIKHLGADVVHEFNERFRRVAPFGRSTIRRFPHNVSDMKKLGARNYEDILQCFIPCFEGLLDDQHNKSILSLLYTCTYWHSLAKLRMHTDSSLDVLGGVTQLLGRQMLYFAEVTCPQFKTVETDGEYAARGRATARREAAKTGTTSESTASNLPAAPHPKTGGKRAVVFSLNTYKHHSMGDYVPTIRRFGTMDSYSTQIGESQHRRVKDWNGRSNKNNAVPQIIRMDVRESAHERMQQELAVLAPKITQSNTDLTATMDQHHRIAKDESDKLYLHDWLSENAADPAFGHFLPRLQAHLWARMHGINVIEATDCTPDELATVHIQHNRIHRHATAAFNYTSYNVQRDQDTINANTERRHIMVKSDETSEGVLAPHPYWYARVLGVFHANVFHSDERAPRRYEFLWVRWFGRDPEWDSGPRHLRLDRLGYVPEHYPEAFGFIDPAHALRACHLVPAFALGKTTTLLRPSKMRDSPEGDWMNYYVMRFVDRDMMIRYLGTGVGHLQPANFPLEVDAINPWLEEELEIVAPPQNSPLQDGEDPAGDEGTPLNAEQIESDEEDGTDEEEVCVSEKLQPPLLLHNHQLPSMSSSFHFPGRAPATHLAPGTKKNTPGSSNQTPRSSSSQTPRRTQNIRQPMLERTNHSSLAPTFPDSDHRSTSSPEPERSQFLVQPNPDHRTPAQSSRSAPEKRKRPRPADPEDSETEDEDPEDAVVPPPSEEKYMAMLTNKGRIAVRYVSFWSHWPTVFALGLKHGTEANTYLFTKQQKEDYDTFQRLLRLIPDLLDALHYFGEQSPI